MSSEALIEPAEVQRKSVLLSVLPHAVTAAMSNFMFGYHIGIIDGPLDSIAKELHFDTNTMLQGLVVSIFLVGAFVGSISGGILSDKIGRRRTFQVDMVPLLLGAAISASSRSVGQMLLGRMLVGVGIGVNTSLVPLYISEVAPTKYRGGMCTLSQIGICSGIICSLLLGIPARADPHWWRVMFWIAVFPALFLIFAMQFAVESPRWLVKKGRWEEAEKVIAKLWGLGAVKEAIEELSIANEAEGKLDQASWLDIFRRQHIKVTLIGGSLFLLQQLAGINGVLYFSASNFHDAGITNDRIANVAVGVVNLLGSLVAIYLVDRQGRRKLLMTSYMGMVFSMSILVLVYIIPISAQIASIMSIFGTLLYMFTFGLGAGPVTGIIIPELCSTQVRAKVVAFSLCTHWVSNFFVGLLYLSIVKTFGILAVYTGFGLVSLLAVVFANACILETKGKSLEEIQYLLNGKH